MNLKANVIKNEPNSLILQNNLRIKQMVLNRPGGEG